MQHFISPTVTPEMNEEWENGVAMWIESNPFQAKLNNTSVYCLNSKVHPGVLAVKGEKELNK